MIRRLMLLSNSLIQLTKSSRSPHHLSDMKIIYGELQDSRFIQSTLLWIISYQDVNMDVCSLHGIYTVGFTTPKLSPYASQWKIHNHQTFQILIFWNSVWVKFTDGVDGFALFGEHLIKHLLFCTDKDTPTQRIRKSDSQYEVIDQSRGRVQTFCYFMVSWSEANFSAFLNSAAFSITNGVYFFMLNKHLGRFLAGNIHLHWSD